VNDIPATDTPATSYPEEWLTAIAAAIHDVDCPGTHCSGAALGHCYRLARAVLDRLAPLVDAEREDVHDLGYIQGVSEGTAAERERVRGHLTALASELESEHKPSSEVCKHAEGIRLAIGTLDVPGD
jgi:hypothetical protein